MSENVLVTGATGKVGSHLVGRLLDRGCRVRAGTRDPDGARRILPAGTEVVELDYDRAETWDAAVQWADRVFLTPAPFDPHQLETLVPFLDWAVSSDTRHVVLLSVLGAERIHGLHLRKVEEHLAETGVEWTFLRPNWFMQNFSVGYVLECLRAEGAFALPADDARVSFVDARDVAEAAAVVLTTREHFGRAHPLTGPEALSHEEAAAVLSEVADRPLRYEAVSDDIFRTILRERGRTEEEQERILGAYRSMREGWRAQVTDGVEQITGAAPTTFRTFAQEHAEVWR